MQGQFRGSISEVSVTPPSLRPSPDDLDLPRMARAALNYLRGNPDPDRDYECKFSLGPLGIPCHYPEVAPPNEYGYDPVSLGDTDCRMDWQYPHMREMAGEPDADPVELGVRRRILGYLRDDHLCWINPAAYIGQPIEGLWAGTWTTAKVIYSLAETYQRTGDERAKTEAHAIFRALRRLAQWDGDRAWYPGIAPWKDGEWLRIGWCEEHSRNYPFIVEPCVRLWECTGDEEALEFARAVTEGFLAGSQPDQGDFRIDPVTGEFRHHVHAHTHAVWGVAHLGALLDEPRYLDWARRAYEFVLGEGTDYGWHAEFSPQPEWRAEICVVGDMVSIGAWLARGGWPHYWDHVERTVRNELRQAQFALTPAFLELFHRVHADKPRQVVEQALAELRKLEGGFVAQPGFDDWVSSFGTLGRPGPAANGIHMMGCCPPEGMRGLWEAWCGTVEERPEGVFVNMSIARDHLAARVTAYRPEDGTLEVQARKPGTYFLRPPGWADRAGVRVSRDGREGSVIWGGSADAYVVLADVRPGQTLTLSYPVPHFTQAFVPRSVPERSQEVAVRWVGNTVEEVRPHGRYLPMFRPA